MGSRNSVLSFFVNELCEFVILQESSDSEAPLDGAKARLEVLRASLYEREREISMLIDGVGVQNGVAPSAYARLLAAVVRQVRLE